MLHDLSTVKLVNNGNSDRSRQLTMWEAQTSSRNGVSSQNFLCKSAYTRFPGNIVFAPTG